MADNFYARYPVSSGGGGSGTVTSVGLSLPGSVFNVTGSPVTTSGTLSGSFINQSANTVFAGPTSGGAATPAFRALVSADIPSLSALYANVNLSNLGITSINQSLIPNANITLDLGASGSAWRDLYLRSIFTSSGVAAIDISNANIGDLSGAFSIAYDSRILYASGGVTPMLDWSTAGSLDAKTNKIINVVDPVAAQDAATKNYVDGLTTKTANTFAGFDGTGLLETVPGFFIDTTSGGMNIGLTEQPNNNGGFSVHSQNVNFDPLQNSPNENWNIYNLSAQFDVNNSGFSQGTNGNAVQLLNLNFTHNNTGPIGQLVFGNFTANLGNGTDPLTTGGVIGIGIGPNYNANVTLDGNLQGYSFNPTVNAAAILGTLNINAFADFANIGISVNGYNSAAFNPNIAGINNNFNYNGVNVSPNITTFTGNAGIQGFGFYGNYTTIGATGGMTAFNTNPNITTMGANSSFNGMFIGAQITTSHGNVNGVTVSPNLLGGDANFQGLNISPNSSGGYTSTNVQGINVNLANITSSVQKVGMSINEGQLQVNSNYDTTTLPASPGFVGLNSIGGEYHVTPGHPVTNTLTLANNLGVAGLFEDDMGPDPFGGFLGFCGTISGIQTAVAIGKTVDTETSLVAGFSVPDVSGLGITDGGTLVNANIITAFGTLNQGGSINITNLKFFNVPTGANGYAATNAWGMYIADTTLDNWFSKNVVIGGVTGKPVGAEVLSVIGASLLSGALDMDTHLIHNVVDPVAPQDAATKNYVDTAIATASSLYDLVVGPGQTYTTIGAAITAATAGQSIFIQTGTYVENPSINKQLNITGSGRGVVISGSLTFASGSTDSFMQGFKVTGNLTIDSGVSEIQAISFWNGSASIITDNGVPNSNFLQWMQE